MLETTVALLALISIVSISHQPRVCIQPRRK
jgi:hypothetical protein